MGVRQITRKLGGKGLEAQILGEVLVDEGDNTVDGWQRIRSGYVLVLPRPFGHELKPLLANTLNQGFKQDKIHRL